MKLPILIKPCPTADSRTCNFRAVTREQLRDGSVQHIDEVRSVMALLALKLKDIAAEHDWDKIQRLAEFHRDFSNGFESHAWWDEHRQVHNRHHLQERDGVPDDVNLLDVLECVADCVAAGLARSGKVKPVSIPNEVLQRAVENTVKMLLEDVKKEETE